MKPTLAQVAGGALGARTRYVRIAYVKSGFLYMGATNTTPVPPGDESSLAISANNLLKVTSPAAVAGFDGWVPLVGSATNSEFTQPQGASGGPNTPVAFGTDWTEPAAGATVAGTTPWEIHWGSGNSFQGAATFDFIICSDLVNELWDVQEVFEVVARHCHPSTRVITNSYSRLWEIPLRAAAKLGLAKPRLSENWLTSSTSGSLA